MVRILTALAALTLLSGCYDKHEWRQKLTLVVETPQGEVSSSAVTQVNATFTDVRVGDSNEVHFQIKGEATVVEVTPGRYLFALLSGSAEKFHCSAGDRFTGMSRGEWLGEIEDQTEPVDVPLNCLPQLVTFTDINDPATVMRVDPKDLDVAFGEGVRLNAVTLEVTDEPVTVGVVESVLGWVTNLSAFRTDPNNPFSSTLSREIGYLRSK